MVREGVRFVDCVVRTSPRRGEVMEAQRTVRRCVNRIAASEDPAEHFRRGIRTHNNIDRDSNKNDTATAKLLYDTIARGGTDVTNEILLHLEHAPPKGREATVAVGFSGLGPDAIYTPRDVQLFANAYDCRVTYHVAKIKNGGQANNNNDGSDGSALEEEEEVIVCEPNGEPLPTAHQNRVMGEDNVLEGFLNYLHNMMPQGMMPPGMMAPNANNNNANNNDANNNDANDDANDGEEGAGNGAIPGANDGNGNAAGGGEGADAMDNNEANNGAQQPPPEMPQAVANFLNHVMNEAGVGGFPNDANNGNNNNGNNDHANHHGAEEEEDNPDVEDVADDEPDHNANHRNPPPPPRMDDRGGFHFHLPGGMGEAHVHVAQVNVPHGGGGGGGEGGEGGFPPGGVPMPPPGAFFQMPGMPAGVQVAVAQAQVGANNDGGMMGGAMPPMGAFQPIPGVPGGFHAVQAFPVALGNDGNGENNGVPVDHQGPVPGFAAALMEAAAEGAFAPPPPDEGSESDEEEGTEMEIED